MWLWLALGQLSYDWLVHICQVMKTELSCKPATESQGILEDLKWAKCKSARKECTSMEWIRRKEWSVGGGSSVGTTEFIKDRKWWDGEQWVMERDGAREVSEEVMIKSRMWLWSWVGKVTCWLRLKEERRERNWEVRGSSVSSICMLKVQSSCKAWNQPS